MSETTPIKRATPMDITDLDARLSGPMRVQWSPEIHIDRNVSFSRSRDGDEWGVCFFRTDPAALADMNANPGRDHATASIQVVDPTVCAFLDRFMALLANPAGESETFGERSATAEDAA